MSDTCAGCKNRTVEPNCHDISRCESWRRQKEKEARTKDARKQDEKTSYEPFIQGTERITKSMRNR